MKLVVVIELLNLVVKEELGHKVSHSIDGFPYGSLDVTDFRKKLKKR